MPPIAVLVALADPTRCRIVEILRDGPQPVHVLAASFDISRPAISRHLRVLKQARLISEKKLGRENRYALHPAKLKPLQDWLQGLTPAPKLVETVVMLAPVPEPEPILLVAEPPVAPPVARATPKPRAAMPVSQMGFDF